VFITMSSSADIAICVQRKYQTQTGSTARSAAAIEACGGMRTYPAQM
jgi:hypothetical protein